jgi:YVTN family beta-propeller protein
MITCRSRRTRCARERHHFVEVTAMHATSLVRPGSPFLASLLLACGLAAQTDAYAANTGSASVSVTDTRTHTVVATIPVGTSPIEVAASPDASRVYVTNFGSGTVSVIDTAARAVVATIAVGTYPSGVGVTLDGTRVYVVRDGAGQLLVIDAATNAIAAIVPVPVSSGQAPSHRSAAPRPTARSR